jgi:drug/metabolite transporter (DMT)-like permease
MSRAEDREFLSLLGEERPIHRLINLVIATLVGIFVLATVIAAFFVPSFLHSFLHIYLAFCILLLFGAEVLIVHWYRSGELNERFRYLIYYLAVVICLICIGAILFFAKTSSNDPAPSTVAPTTLKP